MKNDHDPVKIHDALCADHRRLDVFFERLLNRVRVNDTALALEAWADFEHGLVRHLEVEEQSMLPLLEPKHPGEVEAIRAEHAKVRSLLAELGVGLEIHIVREETVEAFIRLLRTHAAREEALLYRWAEGALDEEQKVSIVDRLLFRAHGRKDATPAD